MGRPDHYFNPTVAEKYGVDVAIFLHNIFTGLSTTKIIRRISMKADIGHTIQSPLFVRYTHTGARDRSNVSHPLVKKRGCF